MINPMMGTLKNTVKPRSVIICAKMKKPHIIPFTIKLNLIEVTIRLFSFRIEFAATLPANHIEMINPTISARTENPIDSKIKPKADLSLLVKVENTISIKTKPNGNPKR